MRPQLFKNMFVFSGLIFSLVFAVPSAVRAEECTLILDAQTGRTIIERGSCSSRYTPSSTFKVALAVMGYDSGILEDSHTPRWNWQLGMRALSRDKRPVDPTIWQDNSVLWYSREITRLLGEDRFSSYVTQFGYGNMDVSGDRGAGNGLSNAWITSSLQISPREQTAFIRRLLAHNLSVSDAAYAQAMSIVPTFSTKSGWHGHGKTGSGWLRSSNGKPIKNKPVGWYVGWAERQGHIVVFARVGVGNIDGRQGLIEKENLIASLGKL